MNHLMSELMIKIVLSIRNGVHDNNDQIREKSYRCVISFFQVCSTMDK